LVEPGALSCVMLDLLSRSLCVTAFSYSPSTLSFASYPAR
jgi:hypothetical protein